MTNQIIINTDQSSKRLIILVSILTSLSVTLAFNLLSYGLPVGAVDPAPTRISETSDICGPGFKAVGGIERYRDTKICYQQCGYIKQPGKTLVGFSAGSRAVRVSCPPTRR